VSRLLQLKQWVTVSEAAHYLTKAINESVSESDIYRFALERQLELSIRFPNKQPAKKVTKFVNFWDDFTFDQFLWASQLDSCECAIFENIDYPENLIGVYQLPLIGAERIEIEQAYSDLQQPFDVLSPPGIRTEEKNDLGTFVKNVDGVLYCLVERTEFELVDDECQELNPYGSENEIVTRYPAQNYLPLDGTLVVLTKELTRFIQSATAPIEMQQEKTLTTKERKSLHLIIAALIELAEYDMEHPYTAAKEIMYKIKESSHITENTVATHLKAAIETASNP